jgi:hypothetical protein
MRNDGDNGFFNSEVRSFIFYGVLAIFGFLALIFCIGWCSQGNDLFMNKVFQPQYEQVRHDTYKHSEAYNAGMAKDLNRMREEYMTADKERKPGLAAVIRSQFADYNINRIEDPELRAFLADIRNGSAQ